MLEEYYITPEHYDKAEKNGICRETLQARFNRGWDMERATTLPPYFFKERARELKETLERLGIAHSTYCQRLKRGWSVEKALTTPKNHRGINKKSLRQLSIEHNINYQTLIARVKYGWDLEKALKTPIQVNRRRLSDRKQEENNG